MYILQYALHTYVCTYLFYFTGKCTAKNTLLGSNASIMSIEFDDLVSDYYMYYSYVMVHMYV